MSGKYIHFVRNAAAGYRVDGTRFAERETTGARVNRFHTRVQSKESEGEKRKIDHARCAEPCHEHNNR